MPKHLPISYNKYFLVPFMAWVVLGGIVQVAFTQEELFSMGNAHFTAPMDWLMYYDTWMGEGIVITAVLLLLMVFPMFRNWWYFITALACNLIPFFIQQWLKSYFDLPRPLNYFHKAGWIHFLPDWPELLNRSFPSGHSAGAFSFFCFLSLLLSARYKKVGILFFGLAISVCYSRLYLAAHFFEDVYAGSIIGTVITLLVFAILNKYKDRFVKEKSSAA